MKSMTMTVAACLAALAGLACAIEIGPGPAVGTDKRGVTWYREFQDWGQADVRALDNNDDQYKFSDSYDMSRDLVALYAHDDGTNVYFRLDLFDLAYEAQAANVDMYLAIDCATGGQEWFPDYTDTRTDHPWEVCIGVYNSSAAAVYTTDWSNHVSQFVGYGGGGYWRSDLDAVEFGIQRQFLLDRGWNGQLASLNLQAFTCRDGTMGGGGEIAGADIVDHFGTLTRDTGDGNGLLAGAVAASSGAGRAKYAVVAHANQSVAAKTGTQGHIYADRSDLDLHPGFIRLLDTAEMFNLPVNLHISGTLLMSFLWANQDPAEAGYPARDGPTFLARVSRFVTNGPGSLVGGVLAEHIMPYFEGAVNQQSIAQNSELLDHLFGLSESEMKVMHVPERVIRSETNNPHARGNGPLDGKTFEDIAQSGFSATYLDEVTHLHWWFYPGEQTNAGWDTYNCGRWAGGQGNDEEVYHHKAHKMNGVICFMINDREDQSKFGNDDGGMARDTRYTLLQKARAGDSAQLTLVFDDWEAFAGNSFASSTPNNNADQIHTTLRWAANHPWIEVVNLRTVTDWAQGDGSWVIDHGYVYDKPSQTYEWLKRASEHSYDNWYYGSGAETSFFARVPPVRWGDAGPETPAGMPPYGDMNTTGTLFRDSWDAIQAIASTNLRRLAEWSFSAMVYETAWHDEDANPDQYKSRNYQDLAQGGFTRGVAAGNCDEAYEDSTGDNTSGWALRLHGHVRQLAALADVDRWVADVRSGAQGPAPQAVARDVDLDTQAEYILCNNKVYLCYERWGARLVRAFVYDTNALAGDALAVVGALVANPAEEHENEGADNNRCSAFKDRYNSGLNGNHYVDMDFAATPPTASAGSWAFVSSDGRVRKTVALDTGRDVARAAYAVAPDVGTLYTRFGFGPNQLDLMLNGPARLQKEQDASFRGLANSAGGAAYVVAGRNCGLVTNSIVNAGWDHRVLPLTEQFETWNTATNFTVAVAFSLASARDVDGDGLANTNEAALGTDPELADTDGDRMPDGAETIAGSDPRDAGSVFNVSRAATDAGEVMQLRLGPRTTSASLYDLWFATNLLATWQPLGLDWPGSATGGVLLITVTNRGPAGYYRSQVRRP